MSNKSIFRTVMVIGNNPDELMKKYDKKLKVEPYIKYEYKNAEKMRQESIKTNKIIIEDPKKFGLNEFQVDAIKEIIKKHSELDGFQYYQMLTYGLPYDENGNALSDKNPNGKWSKYYIGRNFSLPFIGNDGKEYYQIKKKDIKKELNHMHNQDIYRVAWEVVVEGRKPENEQEEQIYNKMKDNKNYFSNFKDKESYVSYCCARWYYAVLTEKDGWVDVDDSNCGMYEWIKDFYEKHIEPLDDDTLITIFEFSSIDNEES